MPPTTFGLRRFDIAFLGATTVLFVVLFRLSVPPFPFAYDESDYMTAARKGVVENYVEKTSMTLPEFIGTGLKAVHGELGATGLSEYIRGRKDLTFYRHYHGPLYYQWLAITGGGAATNADEYWMRALGFVFHVLTASTIYFGMLWIFGTSSRRAAVLAIILYIFCVNNIFTAGEISSHVIFIWLSFSALILIARFAQTAKLRSFYAALAACTVALCALEYATLLYVSLFAALVLVRREFFGKWQLADYGRWMFRSSALTLAVLLFLWPAGLLKGTLVEGFLYIGYLSKFRKGSFGNVTAWDVWKEHIASSPLDFALFFAALAFSWLAVWRSPFRRTLLPVLIYPTLLFLTTIKNTAAPPRYISSLFAPVYFTAAALIASRLSLAMKKAFVAGTAALAALLCVSAYRLTVTPAQVPHQAGELELLMGFVRQHQRQSFLVPPLWLPPLQYYYPKTVIRPAPQIALQNRPDSSAQNHQFDFVCSYNPDSVKSVFTARNTATGIPLTCIAN